MRDKDIAKHPLTHPGRSSFEALFGRPPRLAVVASRHCLIARLPLLLRCRRGMSRSLHGIPQYVDALSTGNGPRDNIIKLL